MNFHRPENIPYPRVWHRFEAKDLESEKIVNYCVQDLTPEYYESVIELYKANYIPYEIVFKSLNISEDEVSMDELLNTWRTAFKQNVSLVCINEDSHELVGANILIIKESNEPHLEFKGECWKVIYNVNTFVANSANIFEKYEINYYLSALGLTVDRRYRNRGIATEILQTRIPLCKALGIKITANNFTKYGGKVASKVGFNTEIGYQ